MAVISMSAILLAVRLIVGLCIPLTEGAISGITLPSYALAVKSPFLSAWVAGNQIHDAATAQPTFWDGTNLTWPILARVNGSVYSLFGDTSGLKIANPAITQLVSYTSSHTYIQSLAGNATFVLDFFSPVLPSKHDYARHSLPYSYLTVNVNTPSGAPLDVQVFSGIDYTWTAQNGTSGLNYTTSGSTGFFWFFNPNAYQFSENGQMASYGSVLFGTNTGSGVSHACNAPANIYTAFTNSGSVSTSSTSACSGTSLAAISKNFGIISGANGHAVTFTVGLDRVSAINYLNNTQTGYYRSQWPTVQKAVEYVLDENYEPALATSLSLDGQIHERALKVSSVYGNQYAAIVEASVRQTFGAIELTVPQTDLSADPWVFLKEISSDGNVNTVDLIFQSWPIFISLNPEYIAMLFKPILAYLETGGWPEPWVVHDLGSNYPNATGHNDGIAEQMPLFETSTLFILLHAYAKYTGDNSLATRYATLLNGYAEYLVANSLYPASQLISVDAIQPTANQTALAIQSTIGINAASTITGNTTYRSIAASYAQKIYNEGLGLNSGTPATSTHFTYDYGNDTTWNVVFAGYSDVLLGLNTFPPSAWAMQSSWYEQVIAPGGLPFAGPFTDPNISAPINWGLTDWNIETAAISSPAVQAAIVNTTYAFLTNGLNTVPFGTKYIVEGSGIGTWLADEARSTVGTHFAILALQQGFWYNGW